MKKLFSIECKRAILSPFLWIAACIPIGLNLYGIVLSSYGFTITASGFFFENTPVICIFLSIFIPLHIGQEFEVRTINNKIMAGYSRSQIYLTEMLISILCGFLLLVTDIGSILLLAKITALSFGITFHEFFMECILCFVCVAVIAALFTMITMLMHKRLSSIAVALCLTILGLQLGGNTVSDLKQEEYRVEKDGTATENVLYIKGLERTLANGHMLISPFAQAKYQPEMQYETADMKAENSLIFKNASHHWEFLMMNLIEIIVFTRLGLLSVKKQDLK